LLVLTPEEMHFIGPQKPYNPIANEKYDVNYAEANEIVNRKLVADAKKK
jgi:hypothetical protein